MAPPFLEQLIAVTTQKLSQKQSSLSSPSTPSTPTGLLWSFYNVHWKNQPLPARIRMLLLASLTLVSVYIISPSISYYFKTQEEKQRMFSSRRKDKFTTGLINTRNDCFANSSIQAFASLDGLNVYLNVILKEHNELVKLKLEDTPKLPLHHALAVIVEQLQEQISTTKAISVWPFLQVIERIFNSKISTNQNDAHELVQLILETLENENIKFRKFVKKNQLKQITVMEFPFNGLLADQLTCLSCGKSSTPSFHPFSVFSLPVPSLKEAKLTDMLKKSESETITGYNCIRCKITAILKIEMGKATQNESAPEHIKAIAELQQLDEENIPINFDLPEELERFIKEYKYNTFAAETLKSTIVKKTLIVKAPKLLTVHLSRSMFTGQYFTRNGCRVEFEEDLAIDIDDQLVETYEAKLRAAKLEKRKSKITSIHNSELESVVDGGLDEDEDEDIVGYDDDRNEPEQLARIHSKVLTQHEEEPHRPEDGYGDDVRSHVETLASDEGRGSSATHFENPGDSDDEQEESESYEEESHEVLNKENVKYKLRAIIRHQGTHNAGHYECFRHKPHLVKDIIQDKVVNLSPAIVIPEEPSVDALPTPPNSNDSPLYQPKPTLAATPTQNQLESTVTPPPTSMNTEDVNYDTDDSTSSFSRFRSRIGSFVSRRSSVANSNGSLSRRGSLVAGGSAVMQAGTPVQGLPSVTETSTTDIQTKFADFHIHEGDTTAKTKYKKISTVNKYPYWRISDTQVYETKLDDVLKEKAGVYMIYYEKV